jgi:glycosyltransferase involved in cell wall biosynthesis
MKNILISSFDMEVGGVERSLLSLLEHLDYNAYKVDVMLYKHQGDFLGMLPKNVNLLEEKRDYATFRKSIKEIINDRQYLIGTSRILSKLMTQFKTVQKKMREPGYYQMQLMWKYTLPFLSKLNKEYDIAVSYLWPHYFIAKKVRAKKKIAWIHTDFSTIDTDVKMDIKIWNHFDHIVAVSEECKTAFLKKYIELSNKVIVIENINSPNFIHNMSLKIQDNNPMMTDTRTKILTVARLSHAKGIDIAIKAVKRLKEKGHNNLAWYVVGYGGEEEKMKKLILKNNLADSFILLGKKTNPYPYMKECDIYVQPSRYEGKAVTVTEAKILNKPIIITNYPTSRSQIDEGKDGIICEMSVEGIVNSIETLMSNQNLKNQLIFNLQHQEFKNSNELIKLYQIM